MRVLGPGSFGIAVPEIGLNATRGHLPPPKGRLGAGVAIGRPVPRGAGLGASRTASGSATSSASAATRISASAWCWTGSRAIPAPAPILLDIRRIKNRRAFLSAARAASRLRPVVAIRAGGRLLDPLGRRRPRAGGGAAPRRRAVGHPASRICWPPPKRSAAAKPLRTRRSRIVTNAIGPGQLAADAALRDGLASRPPDVRHRRGVRARLPAGAPIAEEGPVHVGLDTPADWRTRNVLGAAPEVGGVLVVHAPAGEGDDAAIAALGASAVRHDACRCWSARWARPPAPRIAARWRHAGVPAFASPEQAVRGFLHLVEARPQPCRRARAAVRRGAHARAGPRGGAPAVRRRAPSAAGWRSTQDEALAVLCAYGIPIVPTRRGRRPRGGGGRGGLLGFPAVVKLPPARAPRRATSAGGLVLDLHEPRRWPRAAARPQRGRAPDSARLGILVQRQVGHAARAARPRGGRRGVRPGDRLRPGRHRGGHA